MTIADDEARAAEARHLQAVAAQRDRIARIKQMRHDGMSRKRLIDIYGQDAVDLALSQG